MQSFNLLGQHPLVANKSHAPICCKLSFKNQPTLLGQPLAAGISCQPSQRKSSSSGRAINRTVRATIAEPSSKDTINTWSRGGHWQVRIAILGLFSTFSPIAHELLIKSSPTNTLHLYNFHAI
jgi:hypothetical protein